MGAEFKGVYAAVVTPFKKDGDFDIEAAKKHLDWLIERGIQGVCVLGATGEYQSVSDEEHIRYVKEIVPYIKDRIPVFVGVSRERPEDVIKLIDNAKKCGADAAMVLSPFYCHPAQDEIIEFFKYINEHSGIPYIVYNNPMSAGVDIQAEAFSEILRFSKARIVKESTGSIKRLTEILTLAPPNTAVFCGSDNMAYESLLTGADGWISMAANFAPIDCGKLYENIVVKKDYETAWLIYKRLLPALNYLESGAKPVQTIKYILKTIKGIDTGYVRKPRIELEEEEKRRALIETRAETLE